MRALFQDRYGEADVLQIREIDVPRPEPGQVLIRVDAAGVDRGTWHLMSGLPYLVRMVGFGFSRPKQPVPGLDLSGTVVVTGSGVTDFKPGDEVFGIGTGTIAEYALADAGKLAHRPVGVDTQSAAAIPVSGVTALQALRDVGDIQPGQRVLIMGASGGVGNYAVQLARHFGASVSGVASTGKLDFVRLLGADRVYDYTVDDSLDGSQHYDLIIDIGGRNRIRALRQALSPTGTLVIVGGEGGDSITGGIFRQLSAMMLSPFVSHRLRTFISNESSQDVQALAALMESGVLFAPVEKSYELEEAPAAIADLAAGRVRGKAIIRIGESA
ncbi:MAG: NAD(P)-dependent alcohol dehydrogenase [Granulosicoccus sp.]|nr:NAD(P)-dependent alcohol dehydrogenase [Granulosicoccus sp.]